MQTIYVCWRGRDRVVLTDDTGRMPEDATEIVTMYVKEDGGVDELVEIFRQSAEVTLFVADRHEVSPRTGRYEKG